MPCKVCGKEFAFISVGIAGIIMKATCKCGEIRGRERAKGCPKCGIKATAEYRPVELQLSLKKGILGRKYYEMSCNGCGYRWKVE